MLPEDERRLQRERDIASATAGADFSRIENSIAKSKAETRKLQNLQTELNAKARIPINNEGAFEDVSRYGSITSEHEARKRYARSKSQKVEYDR